MIKVGYKYSINFVKETSNGNSMFSVGHKLKNGTMSYWTFFTNEKTVGLYDKCKVKILSITSIDEGEYKGKPQKSMSGSVELDGSDVDNSLKQMQGDNIVVGPDDLPF